MFTANGIITAILGGIALASAMMSSHDIVAAGNKMDDYVRTQLPGYCKGRYDEKYPKRDYWNKYFKQHELRGGHHACAGVVHLIEAQRTSDRKKKDYRLHEAVGEMQYTLKGAEKYQSKERKVRADLYYRVGSALSQMMTPFNRKQHNVPDSAKEAFKKSLLLNPRNPKAFMEYAKIYMDDDKPATAIKILEKGLEYLPDNPMLIRWTKKAQAALEKQQSK